MQHCVRQHHRLCFNASLCEKLSFPTHGYRLLRGRSRYQMAQLSESPNHPMRCVRDVTVHGSLSKCSPSSNGTKPKVYFQREQSEPEVFCGNRPRGVTVSTLDSESSDRGSNPREVSRQILKTELKKRMQHCVRQHHRLCFNASLCEKLSFPTHGYRMLRGRSRYQMAQLSESPNHPMRCVRDVTVHGSSQNVRPLLMAPNPKCTSKESNLNQKFSVAIDLVV